MKPHGCNKCEHEGVGFCVGEGKEAGTVKTCGPFRTDNQFHKYNFRNPTRAQVIFTATIGAFFGRGGEFVTRESFENFRVFDKDFPLLVAGIPMTAAKTARAALASLFSSRGYHLGRGKSGPASRFIAARAEFFNQQEVRQLFFCVFP